MPNGDKLRPKSTREHLLSIYGYITGIKKDMKHMHEGIHDMQTLLDKGCKKQKLRAHSELLPNRAVNEWALSFLPNLDIQVEAKMKNQAAEQLHTQAEELGLV